MWTPTSSTPTRKNALEDVKPIHPELEEPLAEILSETYGLIIYQEQIMQLAQKVAGYTLGQADLLRRAMGKKKLSELEKAYAGFRQGMLEQQLQRSRHQGAVGHGPSLRRLRVQQVALRRLRTRVVLDCVPQGELPGRVHGGSADLRR